VPKHATYLNEYNAVFRFWDSVWTQTFNETGAPEKHWHDHFMRQDVIVALMSGDEVIGAHLYTLYNLNTESAKHSDYFHYVSEDAIRKLRDQDVEVVMTLEYLCVNPAWRKNLQEVSVGGLLVSLGTCVGESLGADCGLGMPIGGTKVDKMGLNIGAYTIQDNIKKFGYELKLMFVPTRPRVISQDPMTRDLTDFLWERRIDYSGRTGSRLKLAFAA